jgi:osmotically-inducible protein OsmY
MSREAFLHGQGDKMNTETLVSARQREMAERCLRSNPHLALSNNISCEYVNGVVVLRGCLPTYYLKQLAQEAIANLEGIERIDNQIQVVSPIGRSQRG